MLVISLYAGYWRNSSKSDCGMACRQLASIDTRTISELISTFETFVDVLERRMKFGEAGGQPP